MQRLFGATIAFTWDRRTVGEWHDSGFRVSNETHLWWNPVRPEQAVSWRSTVTLSPGFLEAVCERPVPIDLRVLKALRSPMAIDLYCWLTYRNSYLRKPSSHSLGRAGSPAGRGLQRGEELQTQNPQRDPSGPRPVSQCPCRAGPWWNSLEALSSPRSEAPRHVTGTCGKAQFSTHKRYPAVRINGTPLALVGTHKRYPLPCRGSCRSLPVEARSAVEGALPCPPPGNLLGIPPPPTAATTANQVKNQSTEEPARTAGSEQCFRNTRLCPVFESARPFRIALRRSRGPLRAGALP